MKVISIIPDRHEVVVEEIDSKDILKSLQEKVLGYIEIGYSFPPFEDGTSITLLVNEEGLIAPKIKGGFSIETPNGSTLLFSGRGVICGYDGEGNTIDLPKQTDIEKIKKSIITMGEKGLAMAYQLQSFAQYEATK